MAEKKSQAEQLKEKLFYEKKHSTLVMSEHNIRRYINGFGTNKAYLGFLVADYQLA